jgi:hypothetical protein
MENNEKLIFRNLNIGFGEINGDYFIEDKHSKVYLTADDIDRISAACRFELIENLKADISEHAVGALKAKESYL